MLYSSFSNCGSVFSANISQVIVQPQVNPGSILSNQFLCYDSLASSLIVDTSATGGSGLYLYQWQSTTGSSWNSAQGLNSTTIYDPGYMNTSTYYRLQVTSDYDANCISRYTDSLYVHVYDSLIPGVIDSAQTICYGTIPNQLTFSTIPTGADGDYSYEWRSSTDGLNWNIVGTDSVIFQPLALDSSTYYQVNVTSNYGCGDKMTNTILITVYEEFITGSITITDTICFNTQSDIINTLIPPTGGNTPYSYIWESSFDNGITWNLIPSNNFDSLDAGILTDTTYYRVQYVSNSNCGTLYSDTSQIVVLPQVNPGVIDSTQYLCYDSLATPLIVNVNATGGDNTFNYQWQANTIGVWNDINGADTTTYYPGFMNTSTYYRLEVTSSYGVNCNSRYTDSLYVHVYDSLIPGVIDSAQTICYGTIPNHLTFSTIPTGADGDYSYEWHSSIDNVNWILVSTDSIYQPPSLLVSTYYKVIVKSEFGCGSKTTNAILITVYDEFNPGTISSNDTICYLEDPNQINLTTITTGADGNYIYQWQYNDSGQWNNVNGATTISYQPSGLSDSTDYRLVVSNTACNLTLNTNTIYIVVNPLPQIVSILGPDVVCSNQSDASYTLSNTYLYYSYNWYTSIGTIIGNTSSNCLIHWNSNPTTDNLYVTETINETGCQRTLSTLIEITNNLAPNQGTIILKPNSTIFACSDTTPGIHYQWGYDVINTGASNNFTGDTLQYIQLPSPFTPPNDTNIYRYWVDTYYNYSNGVSCTTRTYFNPPPDPTLIYDISLSNISIYPNPVRDKLYIKNLQENYTIKVIDLMGRKVNCVINYDNNYIEIGKEFRPGVYLLVVMEKQRELIVKFIVQ